MASLCRLSGVFTSAVTSAKGHSEMKSLEKGLGNKDYIRLNGTTGQSTLGGRSDTLQASARKILEMVETQEEAMPPLSPPGFVKVLCHETI
jgi:hypothetical protein